METRTSCLATFATAKGKQKTLRIHDPRPGITSSEIESAAMSIVSIPMFDSSVGMLIDIVGAVIVNETTTKIL